MADTQQEHERQDALQGISDSDADTIRSVLRIEIEDVESTGLGPHEHALVNVGALVALDADPASYIVHVDRAIDAGASADEVIGILAALAPTVGVPRIVAAAPNIAAALDIELDEGDEDDES
jgi:4-carboxymuconolactone decarboxylase